MSDYQQKLRCLLYTHYNLFHSDLIEAAMEDNNISLNAFLNGITEISDAEKEDEDDEFIPKQFNRLVR